MFRKSLVLLEGLLDPVDRCALDPALPVTLEHNVFVLDDGTVGGVDRDRGWFDVDDDRWLLLPNHHRRTLNLDLVGAFERRQRDRRPEWEWLDPEPGQAHLSREGHHGVAVEVPLAERARQ